MYVEYDINILSLLILFVVLHSNIKNGGGSKFRQQLFRALIICDMLLLIADAAILVLHGKQGAGVHIALYALQTLFFFLCSFFCMLWALFCTLRQGRRLKPRGYVFLSLPLAALMVFLVLNLFGDLVYGISENNVYFRGPYFYMVGVGTYVYVAYSLFIIWRSKKSMERREYYPHLLVPLIPVVFGIVQLLFALDVLMVWPSVAVGLLIIQLYALSEKMSLDHLTGLYNRKYLDDYVEDLLQMSRTGDRPFAALMLDIDSFKKINDTYGHVEGDKAIITAAALLKKSVRKGDFVSRYGGDEFLIILDACGTKTPEHVIERLSDNVARYNEQSNLPYRLDFSIGCKFFSDVRGLKAKDIFASIDGLMYQNKQSKLSETGK